MGMLQLRSRRVMLAVVFGLLLGLTGLMAVSCAIKIDAVETTLSEATVSSTDSSLVSLTVFVPPGATLAPTPTTVAIPTTTVATPTTSDTQLQWNRYEESDPHLVWTGGWTNGRYGTVLGSVVETRCASIADESVSICFVGARCRIIGVRFCGGGIAEVTLDGGLPVEVDLFLGDSFTQICESVWDSGQLTDGRHQVTVECAGRGNPLQHTNLVSIDAFEVLGIITSEGAP